MPIVVNGTTIPENVANALNVNGVNITSVVCDGVPVWTQNLFNATWSGNSLVNLGGTILGIETSGSNYRFKAGPNYGVFQQANSNGTFSGNSTYSVFGGVEGIVVSSNLIGIISGTNRTGWVTFDLATKAFSGNSYTYMGGEDTVSLQTAGGLLRYSHNWSSYNGITYNAPYISLT